jgi:hypothetical protein
MVYELGRNKPFPQHSEPLDGTLLRRHIDPIRRRIPLEMNTRNLSVAALLCAPVLLAFQPRGTSVAFGVAEGASKTKTITNVVTLSLDEMSMMMGGQPSPMTPNIELTTESTTTIEIVDDYDKMGDGAPKKLTRTYQTLSKSESKEMEMEVMGQVTNQDSSNDAASELEGVSVVFSWDDDAGEYVASFPDEDGDEELLENLSEDMDFRGLLPDGDVDEGDEWKLDPIDLGDLLAAGGDLKFVPEDSEDEDPMSMGGDMGSANDWFNEDIEGEAKAVFEGTRKTDDGVEVGVIKLTFAISNAIDATEEAQEAMENGEMPPGVEDMSINSVDVEVELEGEGTLLWNLKEGYLYSFDVTSEMLLNMDMSMSISAQGMDIEIDQGMEFAGDMSTSVTVQ